MHYNLLITTRTASKEVLKSPGQVSYPSTTAFLGTDVNGFPREVAIMGGGGWVGL